MAVELRVIYGDTDRAGVVYYGNYLRFFEAARGAFLRARGRSYLEVEALGYTLPVIEAHARYVRPARYDDLIVVDAVLEVVRGASLRFGYEVRRDAELLADGWTEHACLGPSGRPTRFPEALRRLLEPARRG
jgi:acyl-CoA thioester hydrolase